MFLGTAVLVALSLGILALASFYYVSQRHQIVDEKYKDLSAIAEEKERFLRAWLLARTKDSQRPTKSIFFRKGLGDWLRSPQDPAQREAWRNGLQMDREAFGYEDVLILDRSGKIILLSAKEEPDPIGPFTQETIIKAKDLGGPALSDPYRSPKGMVQMDSVCPVFDLDGELLAFFLLRTDLQSSLFQEIQSWPIPSPSAEILILKQEGDDIVFINGPRHSNVPPLAFRISRFLSHLVEAESIEGKIGMAMGEDYRGVKVLADLRPISGTSWFMVTKVDREEILKEAYFRGKVAVLFALVAVALGASLLALWLRYEKGRMWKRLYASERQRTLLQEEFRATLYSIGDGVIATDQAGTVRMMNRVAEELTGWKESEAVGRPLWEVFRIVNENTRTEVEDPVKRVLREGVVVGLGNHTLLISRDGSEIPISDSGAPILEEGGKILGVVLVFKDQREERALRRQLEKARSEWEEIFEAVGHPIFILDPHFTILNANRAALEFTQMEEKEILGKKCYEICHGTQCPPAGCPCEIAIERQERAASEQMALGRSVLVSCSPILGEEGEIEKIIHVAADISILKMAEEALRESEEKFKALVEGSTHGIVVVQGERIKYANPKALEFFGASLKEVAASHYLDYTHPDDRPLIAERYRLRALGREVEPSVTFRVVDKSGNSRWVEGHGTKIKWDGNEAYLVFLEDLSLRRQAEEERRKLQVQLLQAQKMEAVARLAGGVAHDFNNILAIIGGHAELGLMKMEKGHPAEENLREILEATGRSANLVRQLLAFARKQIISPVALDVNETIERMLKMLRRLIGEDIELEWHPASNIWKVYMDPSQLDQIMANLIVNARDAIPGAGKVVIETENVELDEHYCQTHPGVSPGKYVMLAVSDNGCGMDKETMDRIFEPFFTTKSPEKGTGLGLATVYGIVKQNSGHINVYSEPGRGTTFKIYIPRLEEPREETERDRGPHVADSLPMGRETILLVEDERPLLKVYTKFLETLGYKVLPARSPQEAISKASKHQGSIELLLTDVVMPQMSGRDLWEKLRELRPDLRCLFMSGYTANVIAHHGVLEPGMNFIGKPFAIETLAFKLREVLDKK